MRGPTLKGWQHSMGSLLDELERKQQMEHTLPLSACYWGRLQYSRCCCQSNNLFLHGKKIKMYPSFYINNLITCNHFGTFTNDHVVKYKIRIYIMNFFFISLTVSKLCSRSLEIFYLVFYS